MRGGVTYQISLACGKDEVEFGHLLNSIAFSDATGTKFIWYCSECNRYYSHNLIRRQMVEKPVCECGRELGKSWVGLQLNWSGNSVEEMLGDANSLFVNELRGCASDDEEQ